MNINLSVAALLLILTGCEVATEPARLNAEPAQVTQSWVLSDTNLPPDLDPQEVNMAALLATRKVKVLSDDRSNWASARDQSLDLVAAEADSPTSDLTRQAVSLAMLSRGDMADHAAENARYVEWLIESKSSEASVLAPALESLKGVWPTDRIASAASLALESTSPDTPACENCDGETIEALEAARSERAHQVEPAVNRLRSLAEGAGAE